MVASSQPAADHGPATPTERPSTAAFPPLDAFPQTHGQRRREKEAFVAAIDPDAVCQLASRHHGSQPCTLFRSHVRGSFNVCFFVEFPADATRWVVRFPIVPALYDHWTKLQSEVATMQYLRTHTTIPIPAVHAHGRAGPPDAVNPTGLAFLIMDYVEGEPIDLDRMDESSPERKTHLYAQLADIMAQLRQQEFAHVGSLMLDPEGGPEPVLGPALSVQLNDIQTEPLVPHVEARRFSSATEWAWHHYDLLDRAFRLPVPDTDLLTAQTETYALHDLKQRIPDLIDPARDGAPFVLNHDDLRWSNILTDEYWNVLAVIDWEFASTVPRQFFHPPWWLWRLGPCMIFHPGYGLEYERLYGCIKKIVSDREHPKRDMYLALANTWKSFYHKDIGFGLAVTLCHPNSAVESYYNNIFSHFHHRWKQWKVMTLDFFDRDGEDGRFSREVQHRLEYSRRFTRYLQENGLYEETMEEKKSWLEAA